MDSIHRVPSAPLVDRSAFVIELARGKRVVDLGFVDVGRMAPKRDEGTWLHSRLHAVASDLVGIDFDRDGVKRAHAMGFTAYQADCQSATDIAALGLPPADVVIAGELIEHLDRPGAFLEAVKILIRPGGQLVLTTPNAASLTNFVGGVLGREFVNPDHVGWHTWRTVTTLLQRHGWSSQTYAYYKFPEVTTASTAVDSQHLLLRLFQGYQWIARPLFHFRPCLADGLIVVAADGRNVANAPDEA
jgi:2-polyprenyl-3-methyl-5-hydroxy-6-metoxy-1,4-benzoquinol methylase